LRPILVRRWFGGRYRLIFDERFCRQLQFGSCGALFHD